MLLKMIHTRVHEEEPASGLAAHMNTLQLKVTPRCTVAGWAQAQETAEKLD